MSETGVVLITGASSGIGAATAALLAGRGFTVFGASRNPPAVQGPVRFVAMDVRDEGSVREAFATVMAAAGALDGLVCNAGFGIFGSVEETSLERARAQVETNLFGTLNAIRAALPTMRERRKGRVVVVGSLAGRAPIPFQAHYSASKAALDALTLALRLEVAPFGIGVSLVEPGDIRTGFNDAMDWGTHDGSPLPGPPAALRDRDPRLAAQGPGARDRGPSRPSRADRPPPPRALHARPRLLARTPRSAAAPGLPLPGADPVAFPGMRDRQLSHPSKLPKESEAASY